MSDLRPDILTWTGLLARWMEFAKASLALPADGDGDAWRASVQGIITLQAVTFALGDLEDLEADERALARDRAEILIDDALQAIAAAWLHDDTPGTILDMAADARDALEAAAWVGTCELVWPGPGTMVMPAVEITDHSGTFALMQPGTIVMPGEPVAWWINRPAITIDGCSLQETSRLRQVYRQVAADGSIEADLIAPLADDLPPGLPLLVPLFIDGEPVGHFTLDADEWHARQRSAMTSDEIDVRTLDSDDAHA
ncbi:MAG: hypothetical protein ACYTF9_11985 [Planctomycetota bacterium]